ncbi:MAG TPA: saccharopine dehydrogenase NADP-binding domain-containing protein, partial [Thermoanaerobaculia bacterium]|nr:saccharopine dehydrogenase NADP-binding domain-containing protein [Thermoanaerobaculia bacterium]
MTKWMIYGANGYTGELIAREAVRRGEKPLLAGRNADEVHALARELGCEARVFDLDHIDLSGIALVLHCAGPFSRTSGPMVAACLAAGVHYLDITGEVAVFEAIYARDEEARHRNVVLIPGVGFDVVPTDCLAAMLHQRMPDATELWLAFNSNRGGISRGTMNTVIDS